MTDHKRPRDQRSDSGDSPARAGASGRPPERDSIFEILDAPLPSELERQRPAPTGGGYSTPTLPSDQPRRRPPPRTEPRTERIPLGDVDRPAPETAAPIPSRRDGRRTATATRRRPAGGTRRVRRTIRHLDPISILKVSLLFYTFFLIVWLVLVALFYRVLDGMGLFDQLQSLGRDLVLPALENEISLGTVERWAAVIGVIGVILGSLVNAFLAFLYNVFSDLVGGIEVTFQERDQAP